MKIIQWIVLATVLCLTLSHSVFAAGKGANPNGKPFVEIQGQIVEVEGEISSLEDQIESIVGRVGSLEERLQADEDAITSLQAQNLDLQAQIDTNATDISSLQATVDSLIAENESLQAQIDAQGDVDGSLQEQIDVNTGTISNLQLQINGLSTDLQAQIDNNNDLIAILQLEIENLGEALQLKQDLLAGNCPDGSALKEIAPDGSVVCENVGSLNQTISTANVWSWVNCPAKYACTALAYCPSGYTLTGGGNYGASWVVHPYRSFPDAANNRWVNISWNIWDYTQDFYAVAQCIKIN